MKKLLAILIFLIVSGCYPKPEQTVYPQNNYYTIQKQHQRDEQVVRSYDPPTQLEESKWGFQKLSGLPQVKIALLVPLSGAYKELGENMLNAAQMALFSINEPNLILVPIDTKGTPFGAVEAFDQAVNQNVKLVLGPVFSASASAIAAKSAETGIGVVSFSNDKSLSGTGVFAIGFLPEQQIRRVVDFAMMQGLEDFTAVLPNDSYGATAAKEMREMVAGNSEASVLKTEIFRTDRSGTPLKLSKHVFSAFNSAIHTKPPKDYDKQTESYNDNPIKYPRAMLIPEGGSQLKQITDLLQQFKHDPAKIQLLGSSQWYSPDAMANPVLQGAWFAGPPHERRRNFEMRYQSIYGSPPAKLASLAYDGVALAATIARMSNGNDFSKSALTNPRGFIGVDGIFRLRGDGLTERGLAIMRINNGQFEIIDPSPRSFFEVKNEAEGSM